MKELLHIVALFVLAFCLWAGMKDMKIFMLVSFFAFCALLLFANLDRVAEFSASSAGIQAKMSFLTTFPPFRRNFLTTFPPLG